MPRRRIIRDLNYLAQLPAEIFEQVMRYVLNLFTPRIKNVRQIFSPYNSLILQSLQDWGINSFDELRFSYMID